MMKKIKKRGLFIVVVILIILVPSLLFMRQKMDNKTKNKTAKTKQTSVKKDKSEDEEEPVTYSTEYVKSMDSISRQVLSDMDIDDSNASRVYGKDMTVKDWMKIDDKNSYDKCTGKYKKTENKTKETKKEKIKKLRSKQVRKDLVKSLKKNEKKGMLTPLDKDTDGVYLLSSKAAVEKLKDKMQPYDVAYYIDNKENTSVNTYVNMMNFSKKDESIAEKAMAKKKKITIKKSITMSFDEDAATLSPIYEKNITFDNITKTICLADTGENITSAFKNLSNNNCYDFLKDYMKSEGFDLSLTDSKPVYDWVYNRRFRFTKKNENDDIKKLFDKYDIKQVDSYFDFLYNENEKCIHIISNEYVINVDGKIINLYLTYQFEF